MVIVESEYILLSYMDPVIRESELQRSLDAFTFDRDSRGACLVQRRCGVILGSFFLESTNLGFRGLCAVREGRSVLHWF